MPSNWRHIHEIKMTDQPTMAGQIKANLLMGFTNCGRTQIFVALLPMSTGKGHLCRKNVSRPLATLDEQHIGIVLAATQNRGYRSATPKAGRIDHHRSALPDAPLDMTKVRRASHQLNARRTTRAPESHR